MVLLDHFLQSHPLLKDPQIACFKYQKTCVLVCFVCSVSTGIRCSYTTLSLIPQLAIGLIYSLEEDLRDAVTDLQGAVNVL